MAAYEKTVDVESETVSFLFNGQEISPQQTPAEVSSHCTVTGADTSDGRLRQLHNEAEQYGAAGA